MTIRQVHVYVEAERPRAQVVAVVRLATGFWVEALPAARVDLTSPEATPRLAAAIEEASDRSGNLAGRRSVERWDGEGKALWARNRLFVAVEWQEEHVAVIPQQALPLDDLPLPAWEAASEQRLAADASPSTVARAVIALVP